MQTQRLCAGTQPCQDARLEPGRPTAGPEASAARAPLGHVSRSRPVKVPQARRAQQAYVASVPNTVPAVTLSLGQGAWTPPRRGVGPPRLPLTVASALGAPQPRPPSPVGARPGRGGDPRQGPRALRPVAAPPRKGGAAHRSPGRRLQGAAHCRRPPAEAAPRACSTRTAMLLRSLGSHRLDRR